MHVCNMPWWHKFKLEPTCRKMAQQPTNPFSNLTTDQHPNAQKFKLHKHSN